MPFLMLKAIVLCVMHPVSQRANQNQYKTTDLIESEGSYATKIDRIIGLHTHVAYLYTDIIHFTISYFLIIMLYNLIAICPFFASYVLLNNLFN